MGGWVAVGGDSRVQLPARLLVMVGRSGGAWVQPNLLCQLRPRLMWQLRAAPHPLQRDPNDGVVDQLVTQVCTHRTGRKVRKTERAEGRCQQADGRSRLQAGWMQGQVAS